MKIKIIIFLLFILILQSLKISANDNFLDHNYCDGNDFYYYYTFEADNKNFEYILDIGWKFFYNPLNDLFRKPSNKYISFNKKPYFIFLLENKYPYFSLIKGYLLTRTKYMIPEYFCYYKLVNFKKDSIKKFAGFIWPYKKNNNLKVKGLLLKDLKIINIIPWEDSNFFHFLGFTYKKKEKYWLGHLYLWFSKKKDDGKNFYYKTIGVAFDENGAKKLIKYFMKYFNNKNIPLKKIDIQNYIKKKDYFLEKIDSMDLAD